jgi:spore coat polysaccharide biosynthesis predicted glycosyltransferase SpsG
MGGGLIPNSIKAVVEQIVKNEGFEFDIFSTDIQWSGQFENQANVHYHLSPNDLSPFLDAGRVALVAGGVTTFEMAAKKIPMLILPFAPNQIKNAKAWHEKGFGIYYQSEGDLLDEIEQMGLESVVTLSERAFGLREDDIDCLGAKRIYDSVIQHFSK